MFMQENLKPIRKLLKISQREMARRTGISQGQISRIECGSQPITLVQENSIRYVIDDLSWELNRFERDRITNYLDGPIACPEYEEPYVRIWPDGDVYNDEEDY